MSLREQLSKEERLERARAIHFRKQQKKSNYVSQLYSSSIYKLAKKSAIVFLWLSQLILIDWLLPYKEVPDKIKEGYQISHLDNKGNKVKENFISIITEKNKKPELLLDDESWLN